MSQTVRWVIIPATLLLAVAGCDDGRTPVYPAKGKVVDSAGKPLVGATVVFHPVGEGADPVLKPGGLTDSEGVFVLTTHAHNDGAPAGDYVATLEWRDKPKSPADDPPDRLKGKFRDPKTSPFKVTVTNGKNELPEIKLP